MSHMIGTQYIGREAYQWLFSNYIFPVHCYFAHRIWCKWIFSTLVVFTSKRKSIKERDFYPQLRECWECENPWYVWTYRAVMSCDSVRPSTMRKMVAHRKGTWNMQMLDQAGFVLGIFCFWFHILMQQWFNVNIIIVNGDIHSVFYLDLIGQANGAIYEVLILKQILLQWLMR